MHQWPSERETIWNGFEEAAARSFFGNIVAALFNALPDAADSRLRVAHPQKIGLKCIATFPRVSKPRSRRSATHCCLPCKAYFKQNQFSHSLQRYLSGFNSYGLGIVR